MTFKLLLGSGSRYRASLLERLAIPFEQASPDIDESALEGEAPAAYVARLATAKAEALQTSWPGYWIIGSDQCCVIDGVITGKPHTEENALEQLKKVRGKSVIFLTGLCLLSPEGHTFSLVEPFTVHFRKLDETALRRYINIEQPLDCAGSFKCEGLGINLFSALEGRDSNSLIGLPLIGLCDLMREAGLDPLALASLKG
ncbi:MAG: nucleoside triphosphate pyrophosphatase [Thalassolituus sp.]